MKVFVKRPTSCNSVEIVGASMSDILCKVKQQFVSAKISRGFQLANLDKDSGQVFVLAESHGSVEKDVNWWRAYVNPHITVLVDGETIPITQCPGRLSRSRSCSDRLLSKENSTSSKDLTSSPSQTNLELTLKEAKGQIYEYPWAEKGFREAWERQRSLVM